MQPKSFEIQGIESWILKQVESDEQSRQSPSLDISKVNENQEIVLCIPKNITKPYEFIGIWLWVLAKDPIWKEDFRIQLEEKCRKNNYKDLWMKLHKILKLNHLHFCIYQVLENIYSSRDLRGNILPKTEKLERTVQYILRYKKQSSRARFHRGYRDKGGRRLVHEIHDCSETTGPNPEKPDFSDSIKKSLFITNFLYM